VLLRGIGRCVNRTVRSSHRGMAWGGVARCGTHPMACTFTNAHAHALTHTRARAPAGAHTRARARVQTCGFTGLACVDALRFHWPK
jgi:hypothetical protein